MVLSEKANHHRLGSIHGALLVGSSRCHILPLYLLAQSIQSVFTQFLLLAGFQEYQHATSHRGCACLSTLSRLDMVLGSNIAALDRTNRFHGRVPCHGQCDKHSDCLVTFSHAHLSRASNSALAFAPTRERAAPNVNLSSRPSESLSSSSPTSR